MVPKQKRVLSRADECYRRGMIHGCGQALLIVVCVVPWMEFDGLAAFVLMLVNMSVVYVGVRVLHWLCGVKWLGVDGTVVDAIKRLDK